MQRDDGVHPLVVQQVHKERATRLALIVAINMAAKDVPLAEIKLCHKNRNGGKYKQCRSESENRDATGILRTVVHEPLRTVSGCVGVFESRCMVTHESCYRIRYSSGNR